MLKKWSVTLILAFILAVILGGLYGYLNFQKQNAGFLDDIEPNPVTNIVEQVISQKPERNRIELPETPPRKVLNNTYHVFQTFNNCGPASLSMALSYYEINISQQELGRDLRPYQHPKGNNDDKSVTLAELAEKSMEYNLIPYHRPNGSVEIVKNFIANDIPVVARTLLKEDEDIGHYRVIKGYDEARQIFIQDDSLQGKNLEYAYDDFFALWKPFSFEYLVLVPGEKIDIAEAILGGNIDQKFSWQESLKTWQKELEKNPNDVNARFNISIAFFHLGKYRESADEFEKVESSLPFRTLWYQIEPIQAYYELKDYDRVFSITDEILNNHNRAYSELYLIRGDIYKEQGDTDAARVEYQKAVFYNQNLQRAKEALNSR